MRSSLRRFGTLATNVDVSGMSTVVPAPAAMPTFINVSLWTSTLDIVKPDRSCSRDSTSQWPPNTSTHTTPNNG